ncbi:proline-rich protein 18 [Tiliqua scincoides]|uniref:proline-rich protein 18 n=1 Tax=Tiliqua scincoides TaxID=71010 RepID=UPI003462B587
MSLPPIAPPPAAAPRLQPRKQQQARSPVAAAPLAPAKPPRRGRGAPFAGSWPSASLPRQQQPRSRAPPGSSSRCSAAPATAAPGAEAPPALAALRFSLSLPPEAVRVLQRRSLEKQQRRPRARAPRSASPDAAKRPLGGGSCPGGGDLRALLQVSLLNERHRYDDVEYEEDEAGGAPAADEGLVRKCTEWLRGVESATARDRADKLHSLPHLSTL